MKFSCKELKLKPNKFIYLISDKLETQGAEKHSKEHYRDIISKIQTMGNFTENKLFSSKKELKEKERG